MARAELLLQQSRAAEAEREIGLAIATDPENPQARAILALCLIAQKRGEAAINAAKKAVGLAPDHGHFHYVLGHVLHQLDREKEALAAANEALRLSPDDENVFALRASIHLALRDWRTALADAEAGLKRNPDHVESANLRAIALVRLGRNEEATATVARALERAPENAVSHANQGWTFLHRNDPRQAQEHFREALRLDPDLEYARQGMLEALKARNPIYRGMLAYYLWMGRQSGRMQWAFIIGIYFLTRFVRGAVANNPALAPVLVPLLVACFGFIYLSWTAQPMFNLLLRLNRFGRFVLSARERRDSYWYGASVLLVIASLAWWALAGGEGPMVVTIMTAMMSVCVAAAVAARDRARIILSWCAGGLALLGISGVAAVILGIGSGPLIGFFAGFLGFQILANVLQR